MEVYLLDLLPELAARGHEVHVCYGDGRDDLGIAGTRIPEISSARGDDGASGAAAVRRTLTEFAPDVVHVHQTYNTHLLEAVLDVPRVVLHAHDYRYVCPSSTFYRHDSETMCTRRAGLGCLVSTLRDRCVTRRPSNAISYLSRTRFVARQRHSFARVVAPSAAAASRFEAAGFEADRLAVIPYFCPVEPLDVPRPLPERRRVLFIGRARRHKGVLDFVRMHSRLSSDVDGVVVGDVDEAMRMEIEQVAAAAGSLDRLTIRPWAGRDQILQELTAATLLIFPSLWPETLGIVGLEALAHGVPVIGADIGGVREWLVPGETGLLYRAGDVDELVLQTQTLLDDEVALRAMGSSGLDRVRELFSRDRHVDRLLTVYGATDGVDARGCVE